MYGEPELHYMRQDQNEEKRSKKIGRKEGRKEGRKGKAEI
jgi:hypothetical protein